jgi:hypothetical protein
MLEKAKKVYEKVAKYVKLKFWIFKRNVKEANRKIIKKISSFYENNKIRIDWTLEFLAVVFVYGLLLNFIFCTLLGIFPMGIRNILALGFVFYFIKEEMPRIINKCKSIK